MVVLHYTAISGVEPSLRALSDPEREVSAHYLIGGDGQVYALVDEAQRAWHAGAGQWGAVCDVNSRSIGIELCNSGLAPYSAALMDALEILLAEIMARWQIPPERVIAHSDLAPGRKIDPGPRFDWQRLARAGLSVSPEVVGAQPEAFQAMAEGFGYTAEVPLEVKLRAFRLRFRFGYQGPLDAVDAGLATDLCRRFPVDRPAPVA